MSLEAILQIAVKIELILALPVWAGMVIYLWRRESR